MEIFYDGLYDCHNRFLKFVLLFGQFLEMDSHKFENFIIYYYSRLITLDGYIYAFVYSCVLE